MIEWSEEVSIEGYVGKLGGLTVLEVTGFSIDMFGYVVDEWDDVLETPEQWDEKKLALEKHFTEWLTTANLIHLDEIKTMPVGDLLKLGGIGDNWVEQLIRSKIFSCPECGDGGMTNEKGTLPDGEEYYRANVVDCECLKNPNSIASIKRGGSDNGK